MVYGVGFGGWSGHVAAADVWMIDIWMALVEYYTFGFFTEY